MTRNKSFLRKVGYLCGIAILFIPISMISAPATTKTEGGRLSEMRKDYRLSQAQLGKIDPASASMSLATLGMRGVAANLLWGKAIHYKKTENWDAFMAALNQITKLQPNFVSVWQFQAWNISYNVSVEFDDFRHRYHWVKKGVDYLTEGIEYNEDEPILLSEAGWFFAHKLGRADEYLQFRRLFRDDTDFHESLRKELVPIDDLGGPDEKPDNWLVANYWYRRAQQAVDRGAQLTTMPIHYWMAEKQVIDKKQTPMRGKNPLVFYSEAPKALIRYADAIEEDGYLDEKGRFAWRKAEEAWREFGNRDILSSWGITIHLNDFERAVNTANEDEARLLELTPGIAEELREKKLAKLIQTERDVLDIPFATRSSDQRLLAAEVEAKTRVSPVEIAAAAPEDVQNEARRLAISVQTNREKARIVEKYRGIVNFEYWLNRCILEQEENTIQARRLVLEAENLFDDGDLQGAQERYELAWDRWADIFDRYPIMIEDVEGEVVMESVERYYKLLGQLDLTFPDDFKLKMLAEAYDGDPDFTDVTAAILASGRSSGNTPESATQDTAPEDTPAVAVPQAPPGAAVKEFDADPEAPASADDKTNHKTNEESDAGDGEPNDSSPSGDSSSAVPGAAGEGDAKDDDT